MARRPLSAMEATVLRRVGNHSQITAANVDGRLSDVHRELAVSYQWSYRRREYQLTTLAPVSVGTVTVAQGSPTVTGAGTAWTAGLVGAAIRITGEVSFFYIGAVNVGA